MAKGKLKPLASSDVLGNKAAHFFKSGNNVRSKPDAFIEVMDKLPSKGNYNTNFEYDIWYDIGGQDKIHGYTYTDVLSLFVYARPANRFWANRVLQSAALEQITEQGEQLFEEIANAGDKYSLKKYRGEQHDFVVFLPGTNIYADVVNEGKLHNAVKQGAKIKMHPLIAKSLQTKLKLTFGKENIIDNKVSGHQLAENAKIVGCCKNSEMGLAALAKGKAVYLFDKEDLKRTYTYTDLYNNIWVNGVPNVNRFKSILSAKYSGLIPNVVANVDERVEHFFTYFKGVTHVKPTNPGNG